MSFQISLSSFKNGETIPKRHTPFGEDYNPEIVISNVPEGTKSLSLIVDDPDAPVGLWSHWLVKDIPANISVIKENSKPGVEITNSWGIKKYKGPKPPNGKHRYFFKLYALNEDKVKANSLKEFYKEVEKKKLGEAVYMGTFG